MLSYIFINSFSIIPWNKINPVFSFKKHVNFDMVKITHHTNFDMVEIYKHNLIAYGRSIIGDDAP